MREAAVFVNDVFAGTLKEGGEAFEFAYDPSYLSLANAKPVSLTLPLRKEAYSSKTMFPFFDGLIPEGWLLDVALHKWKMDPRDRMGLLLRLCADPIGNVSVKEGAKDV